MIGANIVIAGSIGVGTLVAPGAVREFMGIPPGDPVSYGIAAGAVPLAFGLAGVAGLRAPLRLSPVLALQALYKSLFLVAVIAPLALAGRMPGHAVPLIVVFLLFILGDTVAVPFSYLFSRALAGYSTELLKSRVLCTSDIGSVGRPDDWRIHGRCRDRKSGRCASRPGRYVGIRAMSRVS